MNSFIKGLFTELLIQIEKLLSELRTKPDTGNQKLDSFKQESIHRIEELHQEVSSYLHQSEMEIEELAFYHLLNYNPFYEEFQNLEQYRYQPVIRFNSADAQLNKLLEKIYREINPLHSPPFISTISNTDQYYWAFPEYGIIAIPLGEEKSLINLPDLFHEIAHFIYDNYSEIFSNIINNLVQAHFREEIERVDEEGRDPTLKNLFEGMAEKWKESWIEEFTCDIIATFLVGTAYAWTNFKITAFSSGYDEVFVQTEEHPSDASRMKVIFHFLEAMQKDDKINSLKNVWIQFTTIINNPIPDNYDKIFPDELLKEITQQMLIQLNATCLNSYQTQLHNFKKPVIWYLNEAWEKLLTSPEEFALWEKEAITELNFSK